MDRQTDMPDRRATEAAAALAARYGDDAAVIAVMKAAEAAAAMDIETCEHWEAVAALLSGDEPFGAVN